MLEQWEYKVIYINAQGWTSSGLPADLNEQIDKLGAEGWELVSTQAIVQPSWFWSAGKTAGLVGFFKRRLSA